MSLTLRWPSLAHSYIPRLGDPQELQFVLVVYSLSSVQLFTTPWTVALQAPLPMGFCRQEYWNWLPFPHPGDLSSPGIKPVSPALQADSLLLNYQVSPSRPRACAVALSEPMQRFLTHLLLANYPLCSWRAGSVHRWCSISAAFNKCRQYHFPISWPATTVNVL